MACILITDIPIVKALEGQNSKDFEALWAILKTGKIRGYITPNDLQQLEQYLDEFVGEAYAQKLLAGFRSVLGLYGDPDYPAVDLIVDGESVDELADEIPIRSVSDFLCIYELERLWLMGLGEEILADSLFSSIADVMEVLDGDDAFVAKALIDSIVPVEDAPLLENRAQHSFKEGSAITRAIASLTAEDEDSSLADGALADGALTNSDPLEQPLHSNDLTSNAPSRNLLLSPLIQSILDSATPSGPTNYDLRFESEQPNRLDPLKRRGMTLAHVDQSTYNFNVDMFLILGLIMQMEPKTHSGKEENLKVHQALLTRKLSRSPTNRSNPDGQTIVSPVFNSTALQTDPGDSPRFTEFFLANLTPFQQSRAHPFFNDRENRKGDRSFSSENLWDTLYSQNTNEKKVDVETRPRSTDTPSSVSNPSSQPIGISPFLVSKASNVQLLEQSDRPSTPLHPNVLQPSVSTLASVSEASNNPMDSMLSGDWLSGDWRSLTTRMGGDAITITSRFDSSVSQLSPQRLTRILKSLQEVQNRGDRFFSNLPFPKKQDRFSVDLKPSDHLIGVASDQSTSRRLIESRPLSNPSQVNSNNVNSFGSVASHETPDLNSASSDTHNSFESEAFELEQWLDTEQDYDLYGSNGKDEFEDIGGHHNIYGYGGRDSIKIRDGSYYVRAGAGGDRIESQGGRRNTIYGGSGADRIVASDGTYHNISGGDGADRIVASNAMLTIWSGGGNDVIKASEVTDGRIHGGSGADIIKVNKTTRKVTDIWGGSGADKISVSDGTYSIRAGYGRDVIKVSEVPKSRIYGGDGRDVITLNEATDSRIDGGNGNDELYVSGENITIDAGQGDDLVGVYAGVSTVTGGIGKDFLALFRDESFDTKNEQTDSHHIVVTDFELGQDTLWLYDTTLDDLILKQVGVDTHILDRNDVLAVLHSVNTDDVSQAAITIEKPSVESLSPSVFIS